MKNMEHLKSLGDENYVEAIKEGEIIRVPESVAREEDLFILRKLVKPDLEIVSKEERKVKDDYVPRASSVLDEWRNAKFSNKKNNVVNDLIDNFHWHISRNRRTKGISRKELANKIGATEQEIKMIEMGELPKDDFVFISRIENFLGLDLRKDKPAEGKVTLADLQKMNESKVKEEIDKTHKSSFLERREKEEKRKEENSSSDGLSGDDIEILDLD